MQMLLSSYGLQLSSQLQHHAALPCELLMQLVKPVAPHCNTMCVLIALRVVHRCRQSPGIGAQARPQIDEHEAHELQYAHL